MGVSYGHTWGHGGLATRRVAPRARLLAVPELPRVGISTSCCRSRFKKLYNGQNPDFGHLSTKRSDKVDYSKSIPVPTFKSGCKLTKTLAQPDFKRIFRLIRIFKRTDPTCLHAGPAPAVLPCRSRARRARAHTHKHTRSCTAHRRERGLVSAQESRTPTAQHCQAWHSN